MPYRQLIRTIDPLEALYDVKCDQCEWEGQHYALLSLGLKVGDVIPRDQGNCFYGRCPSCRSKRLIVTKVPSFDSGEERVGFWKDPTGLDDSSDPPK